MARLRVLISVAVLIGVIGCSESYKKKYMPISPRRFEDRTNNATDASGSVPLEWRGDNTVNENEASGSGAAADENTDSNKETGNTESTEETGGTDSTEKTTGTKRALPAVAAAIIKNPKVQEAVIEKGIEVAGKLVDKQLKIIDEAQEKAENFLKKEIKLNIIPDKGWLTDDMFIPPGYRIDSSIGGDQKPEHEAGDVPYAYPAGVGNVLMNGCYGTDYKANDPCYNAKGNSQICFSTSQKPLGKVLYSVEDDKPNKRQAVVERATGLAITQNLIDGAAFIGVGFDGRGSYTSESRKMSIVQRNCANKATYDGFDVPDTMNVHGIYDTSANMYTFEARQEYQKFLQGEAGISGSYFGFYAGAKAAWGSSTTSNQQRFLSILDVDVDRYEIFMDEIKPKDLSNQFLREYMSLPESYYSPGAPLKYQDFIQRWGTHYIKSGRFGGQFEIRKTKDASGTTTKSEFSQEMEMEYKSLFASVAAKEKTSEGTYERVQAKTSSSSLVVQGGSHEIASVLSDMYSPTFKSEFKEWLQSIPSYPKAFRFLMGAITDLVNFRESDLFPDKKVSWGCEGYETALQTKTVDGKEVKYYEFTNSDGVKEEIICLYEGHKGLEQAVQRRRKSLKRAIEVYMEEGPIAISDMTLEVCPKPTEPETETEVAPEETRSDDLLSVTDVPTWKEMTNSKVSFKAIFDMKHDLTSSVKGEVVIPKNMVRRVRFVRGKWFTGDEHGKFHLYNGFNNGKSANSHNHKVSILGLVLTFNEKDGSLVLGDDDYEASKKVLHRIPEDLKGIQLAQVETAFKPKLARRTVEAPTIVAAILPCYVKWSNAFRFDTGDAADSRCLHFTGSSDGNIFVVFAGVPNDKSSWYSVEIGADKVAINKGLEQKTITTDRNAKALGDLTLYQSYFVCITESTSGTLIEYGKSLGTSENGDVYLNYIDHEDQLQIRFYAFGNLNKPVNIMDSHMIARRLTETTCRLDTVKDADTGLCVQRCHEDCDPLSGCTSSRSGEPLNTQCNACRTAKFVTMGTDTFECRPTCPESYYPTASKVCKKIFEITTVTSDSDSLRAEGVITEMREATLCFWIKIASFPPSGSRFTKYHFLIYGKPRVPIPMQLEFRISDEATFYILGKFGGTEDWRGVMVSDQMKDFNWHYVCLTYSSLSGLVTSYVDAQKLRADNVGMKAIHGGGTLLLDTQSSHPVTYTEVNIWDRVISEEDMVKFSKTCSGGMGNVVEWFNFWNSAEPMTGIHSSEATCEAPPPPALPAPAAEPATAPAAETE